MDPHVTDWLTKPIQVPWQPICQVTYISVFSLHTLLRPLKLFFMKLNMSRGTKKG